MGRPTDNPKQVTVRARLSKEENELLNDCVKISGKTKTEIIIEGIELVHKGLESK